MNTHIGPYDQISVGATQAPWYVIPFDERGRCTGPLTRDHLVASVEAGEFTDIYLFSHGWNNTWRDAIGDDPRGDARGGGYRGLIGSYGRLRRAHNLTYEREYRPLLVGVFWPSAWLVLPWERAPAIAATDPQLADEAVEQERRVLDAISRSIDDAEVERFYAYMEQERLDEADALGLARILRPLYRGGPGLGPGDGPTARAATPAQLVAAWRAIGQRQQPLDTGEAGGLLGGATAEPEIAGGPLGFDPRAIARTASVWLMKDRAGTVGARGVGPLLAALLAASATARLHVIGHSYGCRVLLSAICHPDSLPRRVDSALLLQPAVSHLCFATDVAGSGTPGGYRAALDRVDQPLMLTFSSEDVPLHDVFHLALIRAADLGEAQIAADEPPNDYAALGGYGPRGCAPGECAIMPIKPVGQPYDLGAEAPRIYALNGDGVIHGHSDIDTDATWWALYNQVARRIVTE